MIVTKDPASVEQVLRAEGKYPLRDTIITKNLAWLYREVAKQEPGFFAE